MRVYTTDALIDSVKRRANIPINQATFTRAQVLAIADDEMLDTVIPLIREHSNAHFVTYEDQTTTTATAYDIPDEAMNRRVYNVAILDSAGLPRSLVHVDFDRQIDVASLLAGRKGYYVRGDTVNLYPDSTSGQTLRIYYERLPNRLCLSEAYTNPTEAAEAGLITGIASGVITCSGGVPSTITTSTPVCVVKHLPGFGLAFSNVTPSGKTSTTVTTTTANGALCSVGDYIMLDGDSAIVQLPIEAVPVLAQAVAVKLLESMGDEYVQIAQQKLDEAKRNYSNSQAHSVEKSPLRAITKNRLSDWAR